MSWTSLSSSWARDVRSFTAWAAWVMDEALSWQERLGEKNVRKHGVSFLGLPGS